jgi:hypothetical protein
MPLLVALIARWMRTYKINPERLIAISRGGASSWYPASRGVELFDYLPVASVRRAMLAGSLQHGTVKQYTLTKQEALVLPLIAEDLGLRRYQVLHPSAMYQSLNPWFQGHMGLADLLPQLDFGPFSVTHPPLDMPLPTQFVAVSFYARATWPIDEERREWVQSLIEGIQKMVPVVVLESDVPADEHISFPLPAGVLSTKAWCTPSTSLAVQAAVLAKSHAFIGTYGGTMQLAVRMKKPAVGFYDQFHGTAYAHKMLTEWLGTEQKSSVLIGRPDDAKFVQEILQVASVPAPSHGGLSEGVTRTSTLCRGIPD